MAETSAPLYKFSSDFTASAAGLHGTYSASSSSVLHHSSISSGRLEDSKVKSSSSTYSKSGDEATLLEKKRKNASAQAAFRQRRSNYISNLEETVTTLEDVVRKLQDACRDAHDDASELRQENVRMKALLQGFEERERIWKAYAKATAGTPAAMAASQQLAAASAAAAVATSSLTETPLSSNDSLHEHSAPGTAYGEEGTVFGDEAFSFGKVEDVDGDAIRGGYQQQCSPLSLYSAPSTTVTTSPTPMNTFAMDSNDHPTSGQLTPSSSVECGFGLSSLSYAGNGTAEGSYAVDANMPPPSYPDAYTTYTLTDFNSSSHRRSLPSSSLSMASPMDYSPEEEDSIDGTSVQDPTNRSRRRHTYSSFPAPISRSPSTSRSSKATRSNSDPAAMSNTLAVIKAQAFGNVRKTRARAKRNAAASGEAAKAALEILEARGLGLGLDISGGVKRRKRGELPATSA